MDRRTGRALTAMTCALALVVAGMVTGLIPAGANHQFPDVATGSAFHDAIDNFANAGCATGFPGGTYRPTEAVNRQQMARFTNACGGRVAFAAAFSAVDLTGTGSIHDIAEAELTAGALDGGGFVAVTANATAFSAGASGFPCDAVFRLFQTGGVNDAFGGRAVVLDLNGPVDGAADEMGGLTEILSVEAGATVTVTLRGGRSSNPACGAQVFGLGDLTLQYFPFDGNGDGGGESLP